MKTISLALLTVTMAASLFAQTAGDYRSAVNNGNWGTAATWETFDGANWIAATSTPGSSNNVTIRNGYNVLLDASGKTCMNLTVESGAVFTAGLALPTSSIRYVRVYGTDVTIHGTFGDATTGDAISLENRNDGGTVTIAGSGTFAPARIRVNSGASNTTTIFDIDTKFMYTGSTGTGGVALYPQTDGNTFIVNAGKTLTFVDNANMGVGSSSSSPSGQSVAFTVNGTIDLSQSNSTLNLKTSGAGHIATLNIGATGSLTVGKNLLTALTSDAGETVIESNGILSVGTSFVGSGGASIHFAGSSTLLGNGSFTLDSGATLIVDHANGLDGVFQNAGSKTLSKSAKYAFSGSSAQTTGVLMPDTVLSLKSSNPSGVALSSNVATSVVVIDSGATLSTAAGDTLFIMEKNDIKGIVINKSAIVSSDTLTFFGTAKYVHDVNGASIPASIWNTGSTCEIIGVTGNAPANASQNFHNFVWNNPGQSTSLNVAWNGNTIGGDVVVSNTNAPNYFRFTSNAFGQNSASPNIITINGNLTINGNSYCTATGSGSPLHYIQVNVGGNISHTGSATSALNLGNGSGGQVSWRVKGNVTTNPAAGGTFTTHSSTTVPDSLIFCGTGAQTFVNSVASLSNIKLAVAGGSSLAMDTSTVGGSSSTLFTLFPDATFLCTHPDGLNGNLTGSGAKNLDKAAHYVFNGSSAQVPGSLLPDSASSFTISNAAGVTLNDTLYCNVLNVSSGALLRVDSLGALAADTGSVNGTIWNVDSLSSSKGLAFGTGAVYEHARNGGDLPIGSWSEGSTCLITGVTSNAPSNGNQNFYNLTWNCPAQTTGLNLAMHENTIGGDVRVINSNGQAFRFTNNGATAVRKTITINGSVYVDTSTAYLTATGSGGTDTIDVILKGNIISKGTFQLANGSGATCTWFVGGDVQSLGGAFTTNSTASRPDSLIFNGTGTQLLVKAGTVSTMSNIKFSVRTGSTLDVDTNNVGTSSGTTFTVEDDATLITGHAEGVDGNLTNGGTTTLSTNANYVFDGSAAQVTGTKLPVTVNNLTITNATGVTLSQATMINGVLSLKAGVFNNTIPFTLGPGGSISYEGGSLYLPVVLNTVSLAEARKDANTDLIPDYSVSGDTIKVYGVVTSPNYQTTLTSYYIQDATAGINVFVGGTKMDFNRGDSIFVIGKILQFNGLTEISPLKAEPAFIGALKSGAAVPVPVQLTLAQYLQNPEAYEGTLVRIDTLYKSSGAWPAAGSSSSIYLKKLSGTDSVQLRIDSDTDIDGWTEPQYPVNIVGVASQFSSSGTVNNGYQILPRDTSDIWHISVLGVGEDVAAVPIEYKLYNNYPNPFNPSTTIKFTVAKAGITRVKIYNALGQVVATLFNQIAEPGQYYSLQLNGASLASGMYFSVFESGEHREIKKMMLLK